MSDNKKTPQEINDADLDDVNGGIFGQVWEDVKETVSDGVDTASDAVEQVADWAGDQAGNGGSAANNGWDATKNYMMVMTTSSPSKGKK